MTLTDTWTQGRVTRALGDFRMRGVVRWIDVLVIKNNGFIMLVK